MCAVVWAPAAVTAGSACSYRERVCSEGEYPVRCIEARDTGRPGVPDGEPPPPGYETSPAGETPTYVDQDR